MFAKASCKNNNNKKSLISHKFPNNYYCVSDLPNQKNIYGAALALIAIMYGIMQGIIAVASLWATMALYGNGRDPQ